MFVNGVAEIKMVSKQVQFLEISRLITKKWQHLELNVTF